MSEPTIKECIAVVEKRVGNWAEYLEEIQEAADPADRQRMATWELILRVLRRLDPDDPAAVERVAAVLRKGVVSVEDDSRAILRALVEG